MVSCKNFCSSKILKPLTYEIKIFPKTNFEILLCEQVPLRSMKFMLKIFNFNLSTADN